MNGDTARADRHPQGCSASASHRPPHEPGTAKAATQPRGEPRARGSHAASARHPRHHGDTRHGKREPTENARPPEHTNHGHSRGERGTSRRGNSDHETKIRKTPTPPTQPNPEKSRHNPEKKPPQPQKRSKPETGKTAQKKGEAPPRTSRQAHPLYLNLPEPYDIITARRVETAQGRRAESGALGGALRLGFAGEERPDLSPRSPPRGVAAG